MPDRLTKLLRQRALLQEHLAWLEREIAAESSGAVSAATGRPGQTAAPAPIPWPAPHAPGAVFQDPARTANKNDAESIIEQYRNEAKSVHHDVRRGCYIYFVLAILLLGAGVAALYFYTASHHASGIIR